MIRYGPRAQPAYAWAFDRGDGWSNVGYGELLPGTVTGPSRGTAPSRALLLEQLEELLPGTVPDGRDWKGHHLPLSGWRWKQPDGRVLLVGDAAALVNPMTGEGIYYAVATGILAGRTAARCLTAGDPGHAGAAHRKAVRGLLARHLKHTWTAARLARVPAIVDAGIRAADRDRHAFDALVELGLGDGRIGPRLAVGLARQLPRSFVPTRPPTRSRMPILSVRSALPGHRYPQQQLTDAFAAFVTDGGLDEAVLRRLHRNAGVETRHVVLELDQYAGLRDFGAANDLLHRARGRARVPGARRRPEGGGAHAVRRRPGRLGHRH